MSSTDSKKLLKNSCKLLFLCLFLTIKQGCSTSIPMSLNSVQYQISGLSDLLIIDNVSLGKSAVGHAQLNMIIRNISEKPVTVEVNTNWYNKDFVATEAPSGWQRINLSHQQSYVLNTSATQLSSTHYVVNIREI